MTSSGDMDAYMNSLQTLATESVENIYPGHGPTVFAARQTIEEYIHHRTSREAAIAAAVRAAAGMRVDELVAQLYRDKGMAPELRAAAAETVHCHLVRLAAAGSVRKNGTVWLPV